MSSTALLEPLVGEWEFTIVLDGKAVSRGRTTFAWTDDGAFLVQAADAISTADAPPGWEEHSPMPITALIGLDDTSGLATMLYADARGVRRVYQMSIVNGAWRVWRDAPGFNQRFIGQLSPDGRAISGRWEASEDGVTWELDFEMEYRKV